MNIHLGDIVLALIAVVLIIIGYMTWRIGKRVRVTLDRVNGALEVVVPRLDRLMAQAEEEMASVQSITAKADRIAGRADEVTSEARNVTMELIDYVGKVVHSLRYVEAALVGIGVGLKSLRDHRRRGLRQMRTEPDELGIKRRTYGSVPK